MAQLFLMRWNPAISSYKLDVFHQNCIDYPDGFRIDWSIWDYAAARKSDFFVMMRVGDYKPGIVFYGFFYSDPFEGPDWAGTDKKRYYVLADCFGFQPDDEPIISLNELNELLPQVEWGHGHSGDLLSESVASELITLLKERIPDFAFEQNPPYCDNDNDYDYEEDDGYFFEPSEKLSELVKIFSDYSPSIHSKGDEGFDWLTSDKEWCRCLVIPNPYDRNLPIEIETSGEFTLYFAGSHLHYGDYLEDYNLLVEKIRAILDGRSCAVACSYEGWFFSSGIIDVEPTEDAVRKMLLEDDEYDIRILAEYTDRDVKPDGIYTVELRYFNPEHNKVFSFRLAELTDKVVTYQKRQEEVKSELM